MKSKIIGFKGQYLGKYWDILVNFGCRKVENINSSLCLHRVWVLFEKILFPLEDYGIHICILQLHNLYRLLKIIVICGHCYSSQFKIVQICISIQDDQSICFVSFPILFSFCDFVLLKLFNSFASILCIFCLFILKELYLQDVFFINHIFVFVRKFVMFVFHLT